MAGESFSVKLPAELLERLHELAELEDRSVSSVVRRACWAYLSEHLPGYTLSPAAVSQTPTTTTRKGNR